MFGIFLLCTSQLTSRLCVSVCVRCHASSPVLTGENTKIIKREETFCVLGAGNETSSVSAKFAMEEILRDERNAIEVAQEKRPNSGGRKFFVGSHTKMCTRAVPLLLFSLRCGRSLATRWGCCAQKLRVWLFIFISTRCIKIFSILSSWRAVCLAWVIALNIFNKKLK